MSAERTTASFPTTAWSVLLAARDLANPESLAAMNRLIAGYWRPVFYYLRSHGKSLHEAEDLTQEFFLRCIQRRWLAPADPSRGRFRTFLLTILSRFVADQSAPRAPRQHSFEQRLVPISALMAEKDRRFEPSEAQRPEDVFMRQWARSVIHNVQQHLKFWCEQNGRPDWYRVFAARHAYESPGPRTSQGRIAQTLGLTRDQVRYALAKTEARFVELLRAEIADQVGSADDINDEIQEIERLLQR